MTHHTLLIVSLDSYTAEKYLGVRQSQDYAPLIFLIPQDVAQHYNVTNYTEELIPEYMSVEMRNMKIFEQQEREQSADVKFVPDSFLHKFHHFGSECELSRVCELSQPCMLSTIISVPIAAEDIEDKIESE